MLQHTKKMAWVWVIMAAFTSGIVVAEDAAEKAVPAVALYDQVLVDLGRQKAAELGHNPVPVYMGEKGISICQGTRFSIRNGSFAVAENDMLINVGNAPVDAGDHKLQQGEYSVVKDDAFTAPKELAGTSASAEPLAPALLKYTTLCANEAMEGDDFTMASVLRINKAMAPDGSKNTVQDTFLYRVYEYTGKKEPEHSKYAKGGKDSCHEDSGMGIFVCPLFAPALEVSQNGATQKGGFEPVLISSDFLELSRWEQEEFMQEFNNQLQNVTYTGELTLKDSVEAEVSLRLGVVIVGAMANPMYFGGHTWYTKFKSLVQTDKAVMRFTPASGETYTLKAWGDGSLLQYKASIVDGNGQEVASTSLALREEDKDKVACGIYLREGLL